MRGLLRRLGIEKFAEKVGKVINRPPQSTIIAWADVETFEKEAGRLRLSVPLDELSKLHPADLAKIVNELDPAQRTEVFETLDLETAAQTLPEAHPDIQADIIESLNDERAADILEEMEPDEAADVLQDLSPDRRQDLLEEMEDEEAEDVKELLEYDEETAGGLMTNEFVSVTRQMTAQETIDLLRELEPDTETIYYVYVVDEDGGLVGVISLRDLIVARPDVKVEQFMVKNVISVRVDGTVEEIAKTMGDYNLLALPVVDEEGRLEGIITVDDALQRILPEDWRRRVPRVWSG
jgi:Mg2+ transporter MgtE